MYKFDFCVCLCQSFLSKCYQELIEYEALLAICENPKKCGIWQHQNPVLSFFECY